MSAWAGAFQAIHMTIAMARKEQHWMLSEADAQTYGRAAFNMMRHFNLAATQKALDIGAFVTTVCAMETPRIWKSMEAKAQRRAQRQQQPPPQGNVYTMHPHQQRQPQAAGTPAGTPADPQPIGGGHVEGFRPDGVDDPHGPH